jgi:hypothetical protein
MRYNINITNQPKEYNMIQTSKPNVKLNGIEYLLLSIQSNPGKSQRWHLKRKYMYQHGRPDSHKGGSGCGYFISPSYRNVLWVDMSFGRATQVRYGCSSSVNSMFGSYTGNAYGDHPRYAYRNSCSQMHLTPSGWRRANEARKKIGLETRPNPM